MTALHMPTIKEVNALLEQQRDLRDLTDEQKECVRTFATAVASLAQEPAHTRDVEPECWTENQRRNTTAEDFITLGVLFPKPDEPMIEYARMFITLCLQEAIVQTGYRNELKRFPLFCTYKGRRYRVTGASTMGDVWLAKNVTRTEGYDLRVWPSECSQWSNDVSTNF